MSLHAGNHHFVLSNEQLSIHFGIHIQLLTTLAVSRTRWSKGTGLQGLGKLAGVTGPAC